MNDSQEHIGVPIPPPAPPAAPPAAPPPPTAQAQPTASRANPMVTAGRARGLHPKSPVVACLLSLMPGVGQIYVGYYRLGFMHNIVFASTIMILTTDVPGPMYPLLGVFLAFFFIYNVVDAGRRAVYYNLALDGVDGIELPSMDLSVPSFGGSLGGGLTLIAVGVVLLSNTLFDVPLEWIESWWPVAPLLFGVYLLVKALQERGGDADSPPLA